MVPAWVPLVLLYGFIGGAVRALAGMTKYGAYNLGNFLERIILLGIAGILCAYAASALAFSDYFLVAAGYAGVDVLASLFEIASKRELRL